MINEFNRCLPAAALTVMLTISLLLSGCGAFSHGNGGESGKESESVTEPVTTQREPLSTIHIDLSTNKKEDETSAETGDEDAESPRLPLTLDMGSDYTDKFTFLCDSTIYGLKSFGMLTEGRETDSVVTGSGGSFFVMASDPLVYSSEYGGLLTVDDYVSRRRPEYLLLAVGSSDISTDVPPEYDDFSNAYKSLIERIKEASPNTIIICLSILPGSESSGISVYDAERYNTLILSAAESTDAYYLDAASAFAATNGYLRPDCDGGESRLSTTGLKRLLGLIRTHYIAKEE